MDAGNMLKPMLARGELHMIGATTLDEYRKHIEKDAALERRFQPVLVDEPTRRGHHLDPARAARAARGVPRRADPGRARWSPRRRFSHRYITDRFLPDKAIDLVDEACARLRTEIDSMPAELDEITRARHPAGDRGGRAGQGGRPGEQSPARPAAPGAGRPARARPTPCGPSGRPSGRRIRRVQELRSRAGAGAPRGRGGRAQLRPQPRRRAALRPAAPSWSDGCRPRRSGCRPSRASTGCCARSSPTEEIAEIVSLWTGIPVARLHGGRAGEAAAPGRGAARAGRRPGRGRPGGRRRHHPGPVGHEGPAPADRLVHLPRPDRRRARRSWPRRSPRRCSTPRRTSSGST